MSDTLSAEVTAYATVALAVLALVTAVFAGLAFRKQAREVSDQAEMLDLQRQQLADQQKANADQAEVLELQADDLRKSLEERLQSQAGAVTTWFGRQDSTIPGMPDVWGAIIRNASGLPIYNVRAAFHYINDRANFREWATVEQGTSPERIRVLPPGQEAFIEIPPDVRNQLIECSDKVYAVSITFVDAGGHYWGRHPNGELWAGI